jgi:cholera toxin transcriptional activator
VTEAPREQRIYRFGVFDLDSGTGELRKDGKATPRLREQALQMLLLMLERAREVVTREELRQRVWSSDTFVDFDHGLNTAINQLRNALGDLAANPRFIQTIPRRGYRFIAPVEIVSGAAPPKSANLGAAADPPGGAKSASSDFRIAALSREEDLPRVSSGLVRLLFSAIQVMYLSFYVVSLARLSYVAAILAASGYFEKMILVVLTVTAAAGIPIRLYLASASVFDYRHLTAKFLKLFVFLFPMDELWALAPFLLVKEIGLGLSIAATAALLYLPFTQRSLLLIGSRQKPVGD